MNVNRLSPAWLDVVAEHPSHVNDSSTVMVTVIVVIAGHRHLCRCYLQRNRIRHAMVASSSHVPDHGNPRDKQETLRITLSYVMLTGAYFC